MQRSFALMLVVAAVSFLLGMGVNPSSQDALAQAAVLTPTRTRVPTRTPTVSRNVNAGQVDNLHAAKTPVANMLVPLDASAKFPQAVIAQGAGSNLDADKLDGLQSIDFARNNHNHDATYVLKTGDTMSGDLTVPNLSVSGNLTQSVLGNGAVKAGVSAFCGGGIPDAIHRQFNVVNGATITLSSSSSPGQCTIDFGFDLSDRFVVATGVNGGGNAPIFVTLVGTTGSNATFLRCGFLYGTPNYFDGDIYALVY
jgi:hypothetical protein